MSWSLVVLACLQPVTTASAEGVLLNGEHVTGELTIRSDGQLHFLPSSSAHSLPLEKLALVRFPASPLPPFRIAAAHRLSMPAGQFLTGEFLGLDEKQVLFQTAWAKRLAMPRTAVESVQHAHGFVTLFQEDFKQGLSAWKTVANPIVIKEQRESEQHGLRLNAPGQSALYEVRESLISGRIGINFYEAGKTRAAQWVVWANFTGSNQVHVTLAGAGDRYIAELGGVPGTLGTLRREPGRHRLILEFSAQTLTLAVDNQILGFSDRLPALGSLRQVRLACLESAEEKPSSGEIYFNEFSLARAVPPLRRPRGDPEQDDLWLVPGDQLFGTVMTADRRTIALGGKLARRPIPWGEVRDIVFRRAKTPLPEPEPLVRIWLRSGLGSEPDELIGKVITLDNKYLYLQHTILGKLKIDRQRLQRLRQEAER